MLKGMEEVTTILDEKEIKYTIVADEEKRSIIRITFVDEVAGRFQNIISEYDNTSMIIRTYLMKVPAEKRTAVFAAINGLHNQYRFFTFFVDEDSDFTIQYDFLDASDNIGESVWEYIVRLNSTVEKVYPVVMKAMWS